MSDFHLSDLRSILDSNKWNIVDEADGNDYNISAIWKIARIDGRCVQHLQFDGLNELGCLPVQESYGCTVMESPKISLYFSRKHRNWKDDLLEFMEKLNQL